MVVRMRADQNWEMDDARSKTTVQLVIIPILALTSLRLRGRKPLVAQGGRVGRGVFRTEAADVRTCLEMP